MNAQRCLMTLLAVTCVLGAQRSNAALLLNFNLSSCGMLFSSVGDYYAGGADCAGVQGPDYGVSFSPGWVWHADGNTVLTIGSGAIEPHVEMEAAAGFRDGIAFRLSAFTMSPFTVFIGNDDGVLLTETFGADAHDPGADWTTIGLSFEGTATWLIMEAFFDQTTIIDDLTLGATTVVPAPAAGWLFFSACLILVGRRTSQRML